MDCIFCKIIKGDIPSYTVYENEHVKCYLDINPNNVGHTLVIPKKHITDAIEMDSETIVHINNALKEVVSILDKTFKPDGYKFAVNYGICQEVKHYHLHIVPKYKNEPLISDIKEVYEKIIASKE
ncbi:MAG: HIT family protein [Bacilli bacterium]|nr:HIT family protein [Bacilli bacterium]